MASAIGDSFYPLKTAYSSGKLADPILSFNIGTILTYFLETRADFRSIRQNAFELFTSGHVQDIKVKDDKLAGKVIVIGQSLAQMKTTRYRTVLMLNKQGDIIHGSCGCPAGAGPKGSCKHLAALCYTLEDFVKTFVLPEDIPSCTDKLEAWNKPRETKLPAIPLYDIDFQRKRFGEKRKEQRTLKGNPPDFYGLQQVCSGEKAAAKTFLSELQGWTDRNHVGLLINTVANPDDPVEICSNVNPLYTYINEFKQSIESVCKSDCEDKVDNIMKAMKVTESQQLLIQTHTLLQSRISDWFFLRKFRITGSVVGRVCNYYKFKKSDPLNIARSIFEPSSFVSASMKRGLELESKILDSYKNEKKRLGVDITFQKLGLTVDTEHGFLAASPDSAVEEGGVLVGIVECKAMIKNSNKTVADCLSDLGYPLQSVNVNQNGTIISKIQLKPNHSWFHQIQLQLYVCRKFAKFCDLALLHPESGSFYHERFVLNNEWVVRNMPNFEDFFSKYLTPKIIEKFK